MYDMEPETYMLPRLNYHNQKLPYNLFAIVRLEWLDYEGKVAQIDEIPLEDEGEKTLQGFGPLIRQSVEGGAIVSIISPYKFEDFRLDD